MKRDVAFYKARYAKEKTRPGFRERQRANARRMKYGIDALPQGQLCQICRVKPATDIDHNHATGVVRGFLCRYCNVRLGVLEDAAFVVSANEYLKASSALPQVRDERQSTPRQCDAGACAVRVESGSLG